MRNIISKILFTLLVLTMGIGSVWGTDQTFTVEGPVASKRYVQNNIMMTGEPNTKKIANGGSNVAVFYLQTGNYGPLVIISKAANIKKVEIYGNRDTGSNLQAKAFNLYTSADAVTYAIPTTGFTATATNNGVNTTVSSMSDINMIGNNQSYATTITVNFTSPVMAIRLVASANTSIRSVVVTYDDAITPTTELCELHMTSATEFSFSGTGSFTKTNIQSGNTLTDTEATPNTYYYTKTSGAYGYIDLGEGKSFQAGDEIWFDLMTSSRCAGNNARVTYKLNTSNSDDGAVSINPTCSIAANMATYVRYITQAGDPWVGERTLYIRRADSNNRLYQVTIHRAPVSETCPSGLSITGTASYTEGQTISLSAGLDAGNGSITYTWYKGADLASAKTAGSIGTGTSFSKANCVTGDAGKYWCVATKAECSDAESSAYTVSVSEATKYDVAFAAGTGATGEMTTLKKIEGATVTIPAPTFTAPSGKYFSNWTIAGVEGKTSGQIGETFAMPAGNVTLTANWVSSLEGNVVFNVAVKNTAASQTTTIPFYISGLVGETSDGAGTVSDISKTDRSGKYATNCTEGKGVKFTFNVKEGFEFAPTAIAVQLASVSTYADFTFTATLSDENSNVLTSNEIVPTSDGTLTTITFPAYNKSFKGTTTLLLSVCKTGDAGTYRIGKPITITGTIKAEGACTSPTISWDGDQPSSAFTTDGSKTFKVNSNYTDGIALELSENTCGATIAVKPETDNKQWVVSFTGAGSVKVTPKVVGDGSTVCAEIVSGTAKTLTVTQAYTVTFNMNGHGAAITPQVVASGSTATAPFVADVDGWVLSGWYTDAECTAGNEFSFSTAITADRPLYAKWIEDPCTDRRSIFKAVLTADDAATVTGENDKEYAGDVLLYKLGGSDGNRNANATIEGVGSGLTTYKMNGTGAYMYGVLKKGAFQEGDKIQFAVSATPGTLAIYGAKSSDLSQRVLIATMPAPNAAKVFTYRLTAADAAALDGYDAIGIYRASDVTMNPYLYSLEITGCRAWTVMRTVSFDMKGHGSAIADVPVEDGAKITAPTEPVADGYLFQGWYKETTLENAWDFANDVVEANITLYAKWVDDPCTDRQSLSKVVLSKPSDYVATVTGYNNEEYAGSAVIGGLGEAQAADVDPSHEGNETGYKLASGGNAIVFATLSKGTFQEGDKVVVTITKAQDAYKVEEVPQPILDIYYGTNKDDATFLTTISGVSATGSYTYRLTAADITTIGSKTGIGVFRPSSGRTQNPYVYSVEIQGCRSWAIFHTLTFKNADGSATIASPSLEEGVAASTVAPTAPKVDGYRFIGWGESVGGSTANMATYTITDDATLYAVYEEIICPTSGTLYKFVVKDGLTAENLPTVTDKDMSSYVDETGDGALTYTATANNKATINNDGTITLKDATAAYLKVELECAMAAGDQIRSTISGNPMRVQVGTTYDADKDLILTKDVYNTVDITSAMEGKKVLYIARSTNGNANLADFEVYRRPVLTGVTMNDAIVRVGSTGTPTLTLLPANDALVTNQVWTIEGEGEGTISDINATTGEVTGLAAGDVTVKVVLNSNPSIYATATVHVVNDYTRQDVTGSISWSWDKNGALSGVDAQENVNVSETLLANIGTMPNNAAFQSDKLVTTCQHAYRSGTGNGCWQGTEIKFYTTVPGAVTVNYMGTGNSDAVTLSINNWTADEYAGGWTDSKTIVVPSGWVTISASVANKLRIKSITFDAALDPTKTQEAKYQYGGYERATTQGRYGTICLPNGGVMVGADLFEVAYYGATSQKIFFDQIMNGEMEAGIPYIFLPKEGVSQLGVYYTDAAGSTAGNRNGLYGSYTTEVLTRNDGNYVLYNNQYLYVGDESTNVKVGANRAYIKLAEITPIEPALAPGRRRVSMGVIGAPQVTTGVGELNADETPIKVMIDGQLYIIRGEKMYDATGRLVK